MEDIMDFPCKWEFESIRCVSYGSGDDEGTMAFRSKFCY